MVELSVESVLEELIPIFRGEAPTPEKPYSYFARAIRGGRGNLENSRIIFSETEKHSTVLSKHVVLDEVERFEEEWKKRFPKINIRQRDIRMIRISQYFVADATEETGGGGVELMEAYRRKKPISLFRHEKVRNKPTVRSYVTGLGLDSPIERTLEQVLRGCNTNISISYYTDRNINEVVRNRFRTFFAKQITLPTYF
jgi:hypothetical protein